MKYRWYLLFVLLGVMLFATPLSAHGIPQPGITNPSDGGEENTQACYICRGSYDVDTGEHRIACSKPDSGAWGYAECDLVEYDDEFYCHSFGQTCCVN